jgi:putative ABC transport system permease protein
LFKMILVKQKIFDFNFLKLSLRELKGSFNEFKIVMISIFLGVFIITAVGSLSKNLKHEINNKSSELLGGDFELSTTYQEFPIKIKEWLEKNGKTSLIVELRTMLTSNQSGGLKRRIVELKAVDQNWPLKGVPIIVPNKSINKSLKMNDNNNGALIDASLKKQLEIKVGDVLQLGKTKIQINGIIKKEPDRMFSFATFGSRLLISNATLKASGLVIPGSLVKYKIKFIPNNKNIDLSFLNKFVQGTNISIKNIKNSTNNFNSFIDKTSLFISLVGLITLLISGVGISNGVKGYLIKKIKNIAIFKALGAQNSIVFKIYFFQIIFIFLISIIPALIAGISIPFLLKTLISDSFLSTFEPFIFWEPIIISFLFGLIVSILFTIIPISKTYEIKPIQLLRLSAHHSLNNYSKKISALLLILIFALCFLIFKLTNDIKLSVYIFGVVLISFLILKGMTNLFFLSFRKLKFKIGSLLEIARKSLIRPDTFAKSIVISFSIGLALLITLNIIEESLEHKIANTINKQAPNYFLIDIQPNQINQVKALTAEFIGEDSLNAQPMLRGRVTAINNLKVENLKINKDVNWVLKRDRAFSWSNKIPKNVKIISGEWWPNDYTGPLLLSIGDKVAKGLNVKIGDKIQFNILGRNFEAEIFNTREIIWQNMDINFIFILSKNKIQNAPHSWIATTTNTNKEMNNALIEKIVSNFSNISSVSVEETYVAIKSILNLLITIVNSIAFITLLSGVIVLAGILNVSKKDKLYEVAIFKILGARPKKIIFLWLQEFLIIGLMASLISILIGMSVSFILVTYIFQIDYYFNYITLITLSLIVPVLITIVSFIKMLKLIYSKPLDVLRAYY